MMINAEVYPIEPPFKRHYKFRYYIKSDTGGWRKPEAKPCYPVQIEPHETLEAVAQFTGMYDVEDREVYEDDIITCVNDPEMWGVVKWGDYRYYVDDVDRTGLDEYEFTGCRIIGNIYENPEMVSEASQ